MKQTLYVSKEQKALSDTEPLRNSVFVLKDGAYQNVRASMQTFKAELPLQHYSDLAGRPKNRGSFPFGVFFQSIQIEWGSCILPLIVWYGRNLAIRNSQGSAHPLSAAVHNVCSCTHTHTHTHTQFLVLIHGVVKRSHQFISTLSCPNITPSLSYRANSHYIKQPTISVTNSSNFLVILNR